MIRKAILPLMLAVLVASMLVACSNSGEKDPYALVTLRDVTQGSVVSKGFKYKFQNPNIVAMYRNLAIISDGHLMEFIGARSLEDKIQDHVNGFFELSVVKEFSPYVHFKVEKCATETDTIFFSAAGSIPWPLMASADKFSTDTYEQVDINTIPYNRTGVLNQISDKKIKIKARIKEEEEEGKHYYVFEADNAKFRIADTNDGVGLILKILQKNNYWFEGGVVMTSREEYATRMKTKVAGTFEIQYVKYGDRIIRGAS